MDNYDEYMLVEEGEPWPVHLSKDNAFFWLHCMACGILTPWSGIKPGPSAVRMQSPIHSLHGLWDLNSLIRHQTWALSSENAESYPLDHQGIPRRLGFKSSIFRDTKVEIGLPCIWRYQFELASKAKFGVCSLFRCWRRLLRVPWAARRSNRSILKEKINLEYSLEGLMLKLKLQYFGHLMWRADSLEKTLMLGTIEGKRRRRQQRMR